MTTQIPNRTVIVAGVDRTPASEPVIPTAVNHARKIAGAELHFLHAVDIRHGASPMLGTPMIELLKAGREFVHDVVAPLEGTLPRKPFGHLAAGRPAGRILQLATDLEADLVIVGSNNKNMLERVALGSVSRAVMEGARCPVLVARPKLYEAGPEIEPPCPACLEVQRATRGDRLWCERHSTRHVHGQLHYENPASFAVGSMLLRPEG
jgi:nucleotide-binding universal stress UspA family protein